MNREAGFTIIELVVVIAVIGILASIAIIEPINLMVTARDNERADDVASIARKLEQDYREQTIGAPAYPDMNRFVTDAKGTGGTPSGTAAGADKAIFAAPGASSSSLVAATSGSPINPYNGGPPPLNLYVYQALKSDDNPCDQSTETCVTYRLYYRKESDNSMVTIQGLHQQ